MTFNSICRPLFGRRGVEFLSLSILNSRLSYVTAISSGLQSLTQSHFHSLARESRGCLPHYSEVGSQISPVSKWNSCSQLFTDVSNRHIFIILRLLSTQAISPAPQVVDSENSDKTPGAKSPAIKTQVMYDELMTLIADGSVTLIDVREPDELQQTGNLPNCTNIPLTKLKLALALSDDEFLSTYKLPKLQKDGANVVFYGLSSVRSSAAVEIAHKMGYKKARHYPGGMEEWTAKNELKKK